jgi:hypothetical protein
LNKRGSVNYGKLKDANTAKLHNIVDMGLSFSAMIRLFDKGSKRILRDKIINEVHKVLTAESEEQFDEAHVEFCNWGIHNIKLAEKKKSGRITRQGGMTSYGQIAKTFDVVLKVIVYYCHFPTCERADVISRWLHAAVDTKMMAFLKEYYPTDIVPWPATIQQVMNYSDYVAIQRVVNKFIAEKLERHIMPVQFDDIYWQAFNRKNN